MSCFTLLKILGACRCILVSILFFGDLHMLCQKVEKLHIEYLFTKKIGLLLLCSYLALFVWVLHSFVVCRCFVVVYLFTSLVVRLGF